MCVFLSAGFAGGSGFLLDCGLEDLGDGSLPPPTAFLLSWVCASNPAYEGEALPVFKIPDVFGAHVGEPLFTSF